MNSRIPQTDPRTGYLSQREELEQAFLRVMDSGWYILGKECLAFEEEFSAYLGQGMTTVGVGSGTEALHLALRTLGIGPGDGVLTVSHTAVATVAAIELAGALPVFVDVDTKRLTMDPASLEEALVRAGSGRFSGLTNVHLKAILPVHLYGQPADMHSLMAIARRYGLQVIEDCSQAHGAEIDGRKVGTWGDFAAFSFYPTKNLGAFGDAGALVSPDPDLAAKAARLRQYGWKVRYISEETGLNSRLDELQAALLRIRLKRLDKENECRRQVAALYTEGLAATGLRLPIDTLGKHVFHQYVLQTESRDNLSTYLDGRQVATAIHYPQPVHLQPAYLGRIPQVPLPQTEALCKKIISLPMYPSLTKQQACQVCTHITEWAKNSK